MVKKNKVVLLIVEGPSDARTLENGIRETIRKRHKNCSMKVLVAHKDATFMNKQNKVVYSTEIIKNIHDFVEGFLKQPYLKLKTSDLLSIGLITDLDGCYGDKSVFIENKNIAKAYYDLEKNVCYCKNINAFLSSRNLKRSNLNKLSGTKTILFSKKEIPFHIFYFGINLEHALYNKPNCTDSEKEQLSNKFDVEYGGGGDLFLNRLKEIPLISTVYKESWSENKLKENYFAQLSNLISFFEWIGEIIAYD